MNLADITTKCYILALIIRDDGERLLLGDGAYEFKDSQQHFIANTYANDVVELQGTDGQMLAGQVRRTATQTFAGYIGDATFSKQKVEDARRDFLMFFRKKHYYTAVYVFSDGTAIQRDRGYIVNAPSVPELYQRFPEWSVGLNFEDPNYYEYAEDDLGQEIAAHKVELELSTAMSGGLIWDGDGAVSDDLSYVGTEIPGEGKNFQLADTGTATLKSAELLGDAEQTTYGGKNILNYLDAVPATNQTTTTFIDNGFRSVTTSTGYATKITLSVKASTTYTLSWTVKKVSGTMSPFVRVYDGTGTSTQIMYVSSANDGSYNGSFTTASGVTQVNIWFYNGTPSQGTTAWTFIQLEESATKTDYEPYVGGTASPNPDYPQAVNTVTGEQTVSITGKNLFGGLTEYYVSYCTYTLANNILTITPADTTHNPGVGFLLGTSIPSGTTVHLSSATAIATSTQLRDSSNAVVANFASGIDTTRTLSGTAERIVFNWLSTGSTTPFTVDLSTLQIEVGSSSSNYEPYQGQEFKVNLGKNLIYTGDRTNQGITFAYNATTGETSVSGTASTTYANALQISEYLPAGTYTLSIQDTLPFTVGIGTRNSANTRTPHGITAGNKTLTFTLTEPAFSYDVYLTALTSGSQINSTFKLQCEKGSSASSFAPYFTPIELAKIPDTNYRDRIYPQDGKWYIEKQVGKKIFDGTEPWATSTYGTNSWALSGLLFPFDTSKTQIISNIFRGVSNDDRATSGENIIYSGGANTFYIRNTALTTLASVRSATSGNYIYYALATPTTTEITNSELVGQLERLKHAHTYADTTNFSITATSPNLPAFLKVVAFGDDAIPQGGYVWEDGGTGGATTITVDGVDNAQPIWTVVGPATNPSLTNITTGESIQWTGVVPNGQTLVVNMADMTASLSGANVFEFISGSWITLQAGNNRVSYSATAATGIATLEWNGVVG